VGKVKVSKLAKIFHTGTLDHIFDDSGEKNFGGPYGQPKIVKIAKVVKSYLRLKQLRF
jgi:hypothetical protein